MEAIGSDRLWRVRAREADWLSGHLPRPAFLKRLERAGVRREVRLFSVIRRPRDQIRSHLNWLLEIRNRDRRFFLSHPRLIRDVSDRIASMHIDSATKIITVLREFAGIFRNRQSDVILGTGYPWDVREVSAIIGSYEMLTLDSDLVSLLDVMVSGFSGDVPRENRSRYWFDPELFEHPEVVEFVSSYNIKDELLYECVRRHRLGEDYVSELLAVHGGLA